LGWLFSISLNNEEPDLGFERIKKLLIGNRISREPEGRGLRGGRILIASAPHRSK